MGTASMAKAYQTPLFKQTEKEEVRNLYRNLKIQFNITRDENTRLRTQVKQMDVDLVKKEKEIENLTRSLQQQANYLHAGGHAPISQKTNYLESFLVQQLKRQLRETKMENQMKDRQIEELKKNVKVAKHRETDNEVQAYVDECMRLRSMLEQTLIQIEILQQQTQSNLQQADNGMQEDQARLQEALYEQENVLNAEREEKNNLHVSLMGTKEEYNRVVEKLKAAEGKLKKYNEAVAEGKRKQKMINDKNIQIELLQSQLQQNKQKAQKVEKVNSQNANLVTRKYALESAVQSKDKQISELTDRVRHLEGVVKQLEQNAVAPSNQSSQSQVLTQPIGRTSAQMNKKQSSHAVINSKQ